MWSQRNIKVLSKNLKTIKHYQMKNLLVKSKENFLIYGHKHGKIYKKKKVSSFLSCVMHRNVIK